MTAVTRWWAGLRWYLKEATGEARWEKYVARCAAEGREPMSRRVTCSWPPSSGPGSSVR